MSLLESRIKTVMDEKERKFGNDFQDFKFNVCDNQIATQSKKSRINKGLKE